MKEIILKRSSVPKKRYPDYREYLRKDFLFSCAYCTMTELEACGLSFQIDHYLPQEHYPQIKHEYDNLMYTCQKCNSLKSDFYPGKDRIPKEFYVLRPDRDDPREHYYLDDEKLIKLSGVGDFNINFLNLNSSGHKRVRRIRESYWNSKSYLAHGLSELLEMSIDQIPKELRTRFLKLRVDLNKQKASVDLSVGQIIEAFARSPIIDPDPNHREHLNTRRNYLKQLKTLSFEEE